MPINGRLPRSLDPTALEVATNFATNRNDASPVSVQRSEVVCVTTQGPKNRPAHEPIHEGARLFEFEPLQIVDALSGRAFQPHAHDGTCGRALVRVLEPAEQRLGVELIASLTRVVGAQCHAAYAGELLG